MLLIDAANVVGSRPDGWWRDRPGAARVLHEKVTAALHRADLAAPVTLVLEGAARSGVPETEPDEKNTSVGVVHAPHDGDSTLIELVEVAVTQHGQATVLVTADRALASRARLAGAEVVGASWLLAKL